jgi:flagellar biosynthesis/type III secretory pathway ATPase
MTAFYTLLIEGDEANDPIAEEVRSLLDGQLHLSSTLAQANQFPAIDILTSLSRVMPGITPAAQQEACARIRGWLAKYRDIEMLVQMGEYRKGTDREADEALARMPKLREFLRQKPEELSSADETRAALMRLMKGDGSEGEGDG